MDLGLRARSLFHRQFHLTLDQMPRRPCNPVRVVAMSCCVATDCESMPSISRSPKLHVVDSWDRGEVIHRTSPRHTHPPCPLVPTKCSRNHVGRPPF